MAVARVKTFINWRILAGLGCFLLVLLLLRWAGCGKSDKAKAEETEEETEQAADVDEENGTSTNPGRSKAKAPAPLFAEQTFTVICSDEDGNVLSSEKASTTNGRCVINMCDYGNIIPDSGMTIIVYVPGFYDKHNTWHQSPPVTLRGGVSNPAISNKERPRGKGPIIIQAGR